MRRLSRRPSLELIESFTSPSTITITPMLSWVSLKRTLFAGCEIGTTRLSKSARAAGESEPKNSLFMYGFIIVVLLFSVCISSLRVQRLQFLARDLVGKILRPGCAGQNCGLRLKEDRSQHPNSTCVGKRGVTKIKNHLARIQSWFCF